MRKVTTSGTSVGGDQPARMPMMPMAAVQARTTMPMNRPSPRALPGLIAIVLGGFLVGFGARYAGGCTSGHAITGMATLQLPE